MEADPEPPELRGGGSGWPPAPRCEQLLSALVSVIAQRAELCPLGSAQRLENVLEGGRRGKQIKERHFGGFGALEEESGCCRVAAWVTHLMW